LLLLMYLVRRRLVVRRTVTRRRCCAAAGGIVIVAFVVYYLLGCCLAECPSSRATASYYHPGAAIAFSSFRIRNHHQRQQQQVLVGQRGSNRSWRCRIATDHVHGHHGMRYINNNNNDGQHAAANSCSRRLHTTASSVLLRSSSSSSTSDDLPPPSSPAGAAIPTLPVDVSQEQQQRRRQRNPKRRRRPVNKKPKHYWRDKKNLERELRSFWIDDCGIDYDDSPTKKSTLVIPNETLLIYYGRHDLRGAITSNGGREAVSKLLGYRATIMPGRWSDAVKSCPIFRRLIERNPDNLSPHRPPNIYGNRDAAVKQNGQQPQKKDNSSINLPEGEKSGGSSSSSNARWVHRTTRRPHGYWNMTVVVEELYKYVDEYRLLHGRPSVWMPRPNELTENGRDDLKQAMCRFGKAELICRRAGMVPYREWSYFEGQLDMILELIRYCDEYRQSDYTTFPSVTEIRLNGYRRLHSLIQYHGGRKFVALRLGMKIKSSSAPTRSDDFSDNLEMNFGPFDLDFAAQLLTFVRNDQMRKNPPLKHAVIPMPSPSKLHAASSTNGIWLHEKICEFGGYENVARRLGLDL